MPYLNILLSEYNMLKCSNKDIIISSQLCQQHKYLLLVLKMFICSLHFVISSSTVTGTRLASKGTCIVKFLHTTKDSSFIRNISEQFLCSIVFFSSE